MALLFLLYLTVVSALMERSVKREIGHYNIKIRSAATKGGDELKTYFLYTNENPSLQAKIFCEENGIHPDGMEALMEASENMYRQYFNVIKLYRNKFIDDYCPVTRSRHADLTFTQCLAPLDHLWILRNYDREVEHADADMVPFLRAPYLLAEESALSDGTQTMIPSYLGRIFMVTQVCLTSHGHILTDDLKTNSSVYTSRYMTGKMYDDDDKEKSTISVLGQEGTGIPSVDLNLRGGRKRALLLVIPHASNFGHEFLDLYPQLFMFRELLREDPNIPVLVHAPLSATKMFPILHAMDIYPEQLNYHVWEKEDRQSLFCLEEVVTTTSSYANHVSPGYITAFRDALLHNMTFSDPNIVRAKGNGILFSDRRDQPGARDLLEGKQIFSALQKKYEGVSGRLHRPVRLFLGNESLEETIRLFRSTKIFISVHGAQMSNMMFLSPGAVLIEIQPYEFRDTDVFLNLAPTLGVTAFRYTSMSGGHWTSTSVHVEHFLGQVQEFIDSLEERNEKRD